MVKLTEQQAIKLHQIACMKRLESAIARHSVRSLENDLHSVYDLCCEISGKSSLNNSEIPIVLLGDQGTSMMRAWALCPYDFWDILCSACNIMPDESSEKAVEITIGELAQTFWERSKSCGLTEVIPISDLSVKQAIQLTALGAIRWDYQLNEGQGSSVYSPLYTRGWGLAQSSISLALKS